MNTATFAFLVLISASPAAAQEIIFDPQITEDCMAPSDDMDTIGISCIGLAADQCMRTTPGGSSTVVMGACLEQEHDWWDARLNALYARLQEKHAGDDPVLITRLRDMQRAWISYREARCDYEFAQWGGSTGGGPALLSCLMHATAEQSFVLEDQLR